MTEKEGNKDMDNREVDSECTDHKWGHPLSPDQEHCVYCGEKKPSTNEELADKLKRFRTGEFPDEVYDFWKTHSLDEIQRLLDEVGALELVIHGVSDQDLQAENERLRVALMKIVETVDWDTELFDIANEALNAK